MKVWRGSMDPTNSAYWRRPCDDDNKWRRWLDLEVENDVPLTPHCTSSVSQQMDAETDRVLQKFTPRVHNCAVYNGIESRMVYRQARAWALSENSRGVARNRKAYNKPDKKLELINQRFYFWGAWEQYCFLLFFYTFLYYHHTTRLTPENELSRSMKVLTLLPMDETDFEQSMHSAATRLAQIPEASSLIFCQACWV